MLGKGLEQLCVFVVFFVLGVGFSALYIFAVGLTKPKLAAIVFDCIFGAVAIYVIWKVNLEVNNGECRAFLFVGLVFGCVITFVTCKTTLDKLSAMLYNLFTTKKVDDDGTHILQEINSSDIRSSDTDTGTASLHATGNADADVVVKSSRRKASGVDSRSKRKKRSYQGTARISSIRRLREKMGRGARTYRSR